MVSIRGQKNVSLELAIHNHVDEVSDTEKIAFRQALKTLNQDTLLCGVGSVMNTESPPVSDLEPSEFPNFLLLLNLLWLV
jgi:hypothetical protein